MNVVLILVFIDSLCRWWWCTNSLSCLKKLFERETQFRKFEVLFECPPPGAVKKLFKNETFSFGFKVLFKPSLFE